MHHIIHIMEGIGLAIFFIGLAIGLIIGYFAGKRVVRRRVRT
jgi:ABC-type dipeptide/oligopeptide/nickel transport system permease subunit